MSSIRSDDDSFQSPNASKSGEPVEAAPRTPVPDADLDSPTVISALPPNLSPGGARSLLSVNSATSLVGQKLGHFELHEMVGGGGMGSVFRATDTLLDRTIAVKVLSQNQNNDEEICRRFRNEAQSAARLDHENIARVYFVGTDRGWHYIVYEFIDGLNIRDIVEQRGPLPLAEATSFLFQIAEALDHASARDVIHRDIKPSNIVVTPQGQAKLVDMGLARLYQVEKSSEDLTASGVTLGTFDYISPEQARDPRDADVRSDLYSLGCTFYFMLAGRPPFPDGNMLQKVLQHQGDDPPDLREFRPDVPEETTTLMGRMLAKSPDRRFQNPGELLAELVVFSRRVGIEKALVRPAVLFLPRSARTASWEKHIPWLVPVAALTLIVAVFGYVWAPPPSVGLGDTRLAPKVDIGNEPSKSDSKSKSNGNNPKSSRNGDNDDVQKDDAQKDDAQNDNSRTDTLTPDGKTPSGDVDQGTPPEPMVPLDAVVRIGSSGSPRRTLPKESGGVVAGETLEGAFLVGDDTTVTLAPKDYFGTDAPGLSVAAGTDDVSDSGETDRHVLTVGEASNQYRSLAAALEKAKHRDVIELKYDGARLEKPISFSDKEITIRAGRDYQPVVLFRPDGVVDPKKYARDLIRIENGKLVLEDVHVELDLSTTEDAARGWALIHAVRSEVIQLSHCSMTIRNTVGGVSAFHPEVVFFRVTAPSMGEMMMPEIQHDAKMLVITLENCILRGEASVLRSGSVQEVYLAWNNGLLAISEWLLVSPGDNLPDHDGTLRIHLKHVTAAVRAGLCLITNRDDRAHQLPKRLECDDCIFLGSSQPGGTTNSVLIWQQGIDSVSDFRGRLHYLGNRNFYQQFDHMWTVVGRTEDGPAIVDWDFREWQSFWPQATNQPRNEALSREGGVYWRSLPDAKKPSHRHVAGDYALDHRQTNNPALRHAPDGRDAGMDIRLLPTLPVDKDTAKKSGSNVDDLMERTSGGHRVPAEKESIPSSKDGVPAKKDGKSEEKKPLAFGDKRPSR